MVAPDAVNVVVPPEQIVPVPEMLITGLLVTVTVVVAVAEHPFDPVTTTVYVPLAAVVAPVITGFCALLV